MKARNRKKEVVKSMGRTAKAIQEQEKWKAICEEIRSKILAGLPHETNTEDPVHFPFPTGPRP